MMKRVIHVAAPPALEPFYTCARTNQPIVLFRGRVDLVEAGHTERHRGGVVLDWLPSPRLNCWVRGRMTALALHSIMDSAEAAITPRIPKHRVPPQSKTAHRGRQVAPPSFETSTHLLDFTCGHSSPPLSSAVLHVANFPRLHGRPVAWPDGSMRAARLLFEGGGWTILLDEVQGAQELVKDLKENGGFALTHTARVKRTSGETFTPAELWGLVEAFTYFCWLCAEARCGPMLPVGFDNHDRAVWSRWHPSRTESFPDAATWLDTVHADEAEALFPTFMARFDDPYWRQVLIHAIEYLVEAGRPNTVERAIIMAQVLLEGLSYSWLVEEVKHRTHAAFEKRTAAQNMRAMLRDMGIPVAMPKSLPALAATRTSKGAPADGPGALVVKRNEIIHRGGATPTPNYDPLIDAWRLGAWYSELVVLRLCGFTGLYRNRLSDNVWTGAVEPVPWR